MPTLASPIRYYVFNVVRCMIARMFCGVKGNLCQNQDVGMNGMSCSRSGKGNHKGLPLRSRLGDLGAGFRRCWDGQDWGDGTACLSGDGDVSPSRGKGTLAFAQRLNQDGTGAPGQSKRFDQARLCYNRGRIMLSQLYARQSDVGQVHAPTEELPLDTRRRD